jgi:hypothetical protein
MHGQSNLLLLLQGLVWLQLHWHAVAADPSHASLLL